MNLQLQNKYKNLSFGEQGILMPTGNGLGTNQIYSQTVNQKQGQYTGIDKQYQQNQQQILQQQQQQPELQYSLNQHQLVQQQYPQHQQQLPHNTINQPQYYLSSQQYTDDQVQYMQDSKDYQQRPSYSINQSQQQSVEQASKIDQNKQQQIHQNQLLQQRLQDQQIQGELHEVDEEEDEENNYNSHQNQQIHDEDLEKEENQDQQEDNNGVLRRQFDDEARGGEDEEDDIDQEDEDDDQEIYQCIKCGQYADQALIMQCKHILCLNCASIQYRIMLKKSQTDQSQDLFQSIDCESCGISTPLPEQTVKVLLSIEMDTYENESQEQQQIDYPPQKGNLQEQQEADQYQLETLQQQQKLSQHQLQFQQQIQNMSPNSQKQKQYTNTQQPTNNPNNIQQQQLQQRQGNYQQQQIPSLQNKQNINNNIITYPQQANIILEDNGFSENVKSSKQKRQSDGGMKRSQNQSQSHTVNEKNNDESILYCFTCESPCFSLEEYLKGLHKNHNVKNVSKCYEELQEPIDDLRFKIKTRADLLSQDELRLNKKKIELNDTLEQCKLQIKQSFEEVFQTLQQKQQELLQQAEEFIEEKFEELDRGINKVNINLNVLNEFDKNLEEVYYKQERIIQNEIQAFNHYSENKTKILETIKQMDTNLFHQIRDKTLFEFQLDTNSINSHIDSIKNVKVEILRLKGLDNLDQNRIDSKFYKNQPHDKSKKLLEQIIQQHANATAQARVHTSAHDDETSQVGAQTASIHIQSGVKQMQQHLLSSQSLIHNNMNLSPNRNGSNFYINNNINNNISDIFNMNKIQSTNLQTLSSTNQVSPGRYIKIKTDGTVDSSKRFHSPTNNISTSTSRKIKLSPSRRDNHVQKSLHLTSLNLHGQPSSFKSFSISSKSTKQAFNNILQSPSSIVKKYTNQYEKISLQPKDQVFSKQSQSTNQGAYSYINNSKMNIYDQLEQFKRNIEEIRKQGQADENNINQINCEFNSVTPEQQANIAAQYRIRQLQEKLSTKYC